MELDTGKFSGLSFEEARQNHPEAWDAFQSESWEGVADAERIAHLLRPRRDPVAAPGRNGRRTAPVACCA